MKKKISSYLKKYAQLLHFFSKYAYSQSLRKETTKNLQDGMRLFLKVEAGKFLLPEYAKLSNLILSFVDHPSKYAEFIFNKNHPETKKKIFGYYKQECVDKKLGCFKFEIFKPMLDIIFDSGVEIYSDFDYSIERFARKIQKEEGELSDKSIKWGRLSSLFKDFFITFKIADIPDQKDKVDGKEYIVPFWFLNVESGTLPETETAADVFGPISRPSTPKSKDIFTESDEPENLETEMPLTWDELFKG